MASLGLGAVQFGLNYGVSNRVGKPAQADVARMLATAAAGNISVIDTAPEYGDSEAVIGSSLPARHTFRLVTKTRRVAAASIGDAEVENIHRDLDASLARLGQSKIFGVLIHHVADLLKPSGERFVGALESLRASGRVSAIGVSAYDGNQIDAVLRRFRPDIVQLPLSALDQRLVRSGHVAKLASIGVAVHVRSVFLQGALLMRPEELPAHLLGVRPYVEAFRKAGEFAGLSPLAAALSFARNVGGVDTVLVGVTTTQELRQVLDAWDTAGPNSPKFDLPEPPPDEALIDPRRWRTA